MNEMNTFSCPVPIMAPFGVEIGSGAVQDVWDTFIKPGQQLDQQQSIEDRELMAILRAVYRGLRDAGR